MDVRRGCPYVVAVFGVNGCMETFGFGAWTGCRGCVLGHRSACRRHRSLQYVLARAAWCAIALSISTRCAPPAPSVDLDTFIHSPPQLFLRSRTARGHLPRPLTHFHFGPGSVAVASTLLLYQEPCSCFVLSIGCVIVYCVCLRRACSSLTQPSSSSIIIIIIFCSLGRRPAMLGDAALGSRAWAGLDVSAWFWAA